MPRSIWSGAVSFGLVNVPVRMHSAVSEHNLHFNYVHVKDGSRIGYEKICKAEGQPVPDDEIAKAFNWEGEEYVVMADEDFDAASASEQGKTIDIKDFVDYDEIDPIYFERTYMLGPAEGAERVYALLAKAMDESGLAAIAKYVMRDKQNLGCLRVREGLISLEKMYFADEIRPLDPIRPDRESSVDQRELDMAKELIDRLKTGFSPEQYHDTYRDTLCEIIKQKREGETIKPPEQKRPTPAPDLMAALQASLERPKGAGNGKPESSSLESLSKGELYQQAQENDIPGRADMTKEQLVEALSAA
ncbi:MAG TPA: Ku protein [Thermoleophilaceae bacterium]|nr:Ku protein [Thermoleophilaceae bacterium]